MNWLRFKIRWWRWFLTEYSVVDVYMLDRDSRDIIFKRWQEREPKSKLDFSE